MAPSLVLATYCVVVLLAVSSASSPLPAAGGDEGAVMMPPAPANGSGGETPNHWAMRQRFHVGDILDFKQWNGSVLMVRRGDYEKCRAASPLLRFADANTSTGIWLDEPGLSYFIGGSPARCEAGQRMAVRVASCGASPTPVMVPPAPANGSGGETPNQWAMGRRFRIGQVLDFKTWKGSVLLVRRADYDKCGAASPLVRFADGKTDPTTKFQFLGPGLHYFIGGSPARCEAGQRMVASVAPCGSSPSAQAPAPAPAPADVVQPVPPDQSVPSPRPWRMVAYAVLLFLAGFIFTACCLFCLIRCCGIH